MLLAEVFRRNGVATRYAISRMMYTARVQLAPLIGPPFVLRAHLTRHMSGDSYFRGFFTSRSRFRLPPRRNPFRGWTIFMGDDGDTSGNSGRRGGSAD